MCPDQGGTGGSTGLTRGGTGRAVKPRHGAAGAARLALRRDQLGRPAGELTIADGEARPPPGGDWRRHRRAGWRTVGSSARSIRWRRLTPPARFTVVGKPLPRPDVPDKCTGRHQYVQDVCLPGMLHGRVIRPSSIGANAADGGRRFDLGIPDVRVVRIENFLAVVHRR